MPFELTGRNIVVRGDFNRAIIRPKWLIRQGILPEGDVEFAVSDAADMPRLFKFAGFQWTVAHDRLVVKPIVPDEGDPGPTVARVLEILEHTPVSAVGHNFIFENPEPDSSLEVRLGERSAARIGEQLGHEVRTSTCEVRLSVGEDQFLTAKLIAEGLKQTMDLNFHFVAPVAEAAVNAAKESARCSARAREVLKALMRNPT
ncbi:MAG: hypothetical protein ACYTFA_18800 [Planctomycetota bacterium]|jgi:hypothetical protein